MTESKGCTFDEFFDKIYDNSEDEFYKVTSEIKTKIKYHDKFERYQLIAKVMCKLKPFHYIAKEDPSITPDEVRLLMVEKMKLIDIKMYKGDSEYSLDEFVDLWGPSEDCPDSKYLPYEGFLETIAFVLYKTIYKHRPIEKYETLEKLSN